MADTIETELSTHAGTATRASPARYLTIFEAERSWVYALPPNGSILLGRGEEVVLRLHDAKASRRHARLDLAPGRAEIVDLQSQNGTRLNGEPLGSEPRALVSGDVFEIGHTALVYHAQPAAVGTERLIDLALFQARVASEIERGGSTVALACFGAQDFDQAARALGPALEGAEAIARDGERAIVLTVSQNREQIELRLSELKGALDAAAPGTRAGLAVYPDDGFQPEALLLAARAACEDARPGECSPARSAYRLLEISEQEIVLADATMLRLYALIERLASSDLPVLVQGETGTGKEMVAQALHFFSRKPRRLVAVNCAALSESLAESELFGHDKGAFTGASSVRIGLLEAASGGSVFLDEIAELPLTLQAKLLRAIDTQRIVRLGEVNERPIEVRVIAATHRDLAREVEAGRFREDLFFRLNGVRLWVPPLRDRPRELALLASRFLAQAGARTGRPELRLSDDAIRLLSGFAWPGNVRQLKNAMNYAAAAFDVSLVEPWHIAPYLEGSAGGGEPVAQQPSTAASARQTAMFRSLEDEVRALERARIGEALNAAQGNQRRAAELIAMPLRTFVRKLTFYGLRDRSKPG